MLVIHCHQSNEVSLVFSIPTCFLKLIPWPSNSALYRRTTLSVLHYMRPICPWFSIFSVPVCTWRIDTCWYFSLQITDYASLPHFCRKEGSGSSHLTGSGTAGNCFSLDHDFHQQVYNYIKHQAALSEPTAPIRQGSVHVDIPEPDPEDAKIAKTIESEFQKFGGLNGLSNSLNGLKVNGH